MSPSPMSRHAGQEPVPQDVGPGRGCRRGVAADAQVAWVGDKVPTADASGVSGALSLNAWLAGEGLRPSTQPAAGTPPATSTARVRCSPASGFPSWWARR
ncbi:hypothetical protein [Lapillicoccus sp.]|uniref:hypothetical protein n=1 Tax=Lapillicoccus sp. TaxID=1909287 RepID=UPI00398395ED